MRVAMGYAKALPACLVALLAGMAAAGAQTPAEPSSIKATETPWTVSCQPAADGATVDCQLDKQLRTTAPATLVSQITVLLVDGKPSMRIIAPHQLSVPEGLMLQIDGKDVGKKPFTTSVPSGIVSLFPLDEDVLVEGRKGQEFKVVAKTRNGQNFSFSVSLAGFAAGLAKLQQ